MENFDSMNELYVNRNICNDCKIDLTKLEMYFYRDRSFCQDCCPWKKFDYNKCSNNNNKNKTFVIKDFFRNMLCV